MLTQNLKRNDNPLCKSLGVTLYGYYYADVLGVKPQIRDLPQYRHSEKPHIGLISGNMLMLLNGLVHLHIKSVSNRKYACAVEWSIHLHIDSARGCPCALLLRAH